MKSDSSPTNATPTLVTKAKSWRSAAIKLFCLECVGHDRTRKVRQETKRDVQDCTGTTCALYPHRPFQARN